MAHNGIDGSEHVITDELADRANVDLTPELHADLAKAGESELKLCVEVEGSGSLDAPCLDLAVGQRGIVTFLTGDALHVHGDEPLVGEYDRIAHTPKAQVNSLAVDK